MAGAAFGNFPGPVRIRRAVRGRIANREKDFDIWQSWSRQEHKQLRR